MKGENNLVVSDFPSKTSLIGHLTPLTTPKDSETVFKISTLETITLGGFMKIACTVFCLFQFFSPKPL